MVGSYLGLWGKLPPRSLRWSAGAAPQVAGQTPHPGGCGGLPQIPEAACVPVMWFPPPARKQSSPVLPTSLASPAAAAAAGQSGLSAVKWPLVRLGSWG